MPLHAVSSRVRVFFAITAFVLLVAVVLAAAFMFRSRHDLSEAFRWVEQTQSVQSKVNEFLLHLVDAETAQRGYLLTGRTVYLEPYSGAVDLLTTNFNDLRTLIADNPRQLEHLNQIEPLAREKLQFMADSIALVAKGEGDEALKMVNTDRGRQIMDAIRRISLTMSREQTALLKEQEEALARRTQRHSVALGLVLCWTAVLMLVLIAFVIHNAKLQKLIKMCGWSKMVHYDGEWIPIEAFLQKRFNLEVRDSMSPEEAEKFRKKLTEIQTPPK
jgi:CHASE3 domain sensor protein